MASILFQSVTGTTFDDPACLCWSIQKKQVTTTPSPPHTDANVAEVVAASAGAALVLWYENLLGIDRRKMKK